MKILTRYIFKEMLTPTLLGLTFYTFLLVMRRLFELAGLIIQRALPFATVGKLLMYSLPSIIVLTVPMSILFGILIAVGRLSADSEIIAMRALGISMRTIYRPVFAFSFCFFLLSLYLMNFVLPRGNTKLQALQIELLTSSADKQIKPRVFFDAYENLTIYVNDVDPRTGRWNGVFVADNRGSEDLQQHGTTPQQIADAAKQHETEASSPIATSHGTRIVTAETGTLAVASGTRQVWLNLQDTLTHVWDPRKSERYDVNKNVTERVLVTDQALDAVRYSKSVREMTLGELLTQNRLLRESRDPKDREFRRSVKVEIHKKIAFPFACVVFGVLGLPLGITNRRGGKSSGFSLSIAIILVYYVCINNGERMAIAGSIGAAVGMWSANVLLLIIGVYLLGRANRDVAVKRTGPGFFAKMVDAVRGLGRPEAGRAKHAAPEEQSTILNRLDIAFPNIIDRYVLREFLKVLCLVILSVVALFIIVEFNELSGDIRTNHIPFGIVLGYFEVKIFDIISYTLPISSLVATLVTFGMFSKNNEVTAFKSAGMSLYRVSVPIIAIAFVMSILSYFMTDFVLPYSNARMDALRNKIKGKKTVATASQQKLWFVGKGRYIINFLSYDKATQELGQVQVFEFHPTRFRLTRRVYAQRAKWDGQGWEFDQGWMRSFDDRGNSTFTPITTPVRLYYAERPEDFATEVKTPEQMTFAQLRRYIATMRKSGYATEELMVKLYMKTSWPFLSLVMALIALPFAFKVGKGGALYGIGIALILGIAYYLIFSVFTKYGEVGNLPAVLSAWSANILFAMAAIYLFLHVET